MLKGTKLYSILFNKCPRCHEGDFFVSNHAFTKKFDEMHKVCPVCGERYTPEPGFYFGAAYVSYALNVAFIVTSFIAYVGFYGGDPIRLLYFVIPGVILLLPLFYRLARRIWINFFVKYKKPIRN
ncbi:MAG: DUF983 domain-containing protein [Runella sp.]